MKKRLLSILIVNVLFFSNVGFTSLAVEKNMELADTAAEEVTVEASEEGESQESGENTEASVPDSYFDDVEYVKIAAFTQLPEEITDQKIKVGGNVNELNLPDTLEISVVADEDREDRINMQLGRERELIRQLERDAEKEEKEKKTEEKEKEVEEAEKKEASEEGMLLEDGERIIFFDSEGAPIEGNSEKSEEQSAEEYVEEEIISEESTVSESQNVSSPIKEESKTEDKANEAASTEQTTTDSGNSESNKTETTEAAPQEQSSEDAGSSNNESTSEAAPEQAPAESGSEGAGTEESSSEENLISKITSVFKTLVVHAAEDVEAVEESSGESVEKTDSESSEENKKEEAAPTEEQIVFEEDTENASENESEAPAEEKAEEKAVEEKADTEKSAETVTGEDSTTAADTSWTGNYEYETVKRDISTYSPEEISVEMVSGIKWILDPLKNEYNEFTTDVVGRQFTFIPVLVIPDYYYVEADLPTIRVTVVEEIFDFDKVVTVDNVKIRVRADKGVFPEGATLFAQKLQEEDEKKVQDAVAGQMEESANIVKSYTFDIQIRDKDGNEIEPDTEKGRVFVSFETEEVSNAELNAEIYHIVETENAGEAKETSNAASSSDSSENTEEKKSDEAAEGEKAETEEVSGEKASEEKPAEEKSTEADGQEKSADAEKKDTQEKITLDGEFAVKKLETTVVEGEETKAVEAVTDGFSTYSVVFKYTGTKDFEFKEDTIINVKKIIFNTIDKVTTDNNNDGKIDENDVTGTISNVKIKNEKEELVDKNDYLYVDRLKTDDLTQYNDDTNANGVYTYDTTGTHYFLIVKRPFNDTNTLVIYYDKNDGNGAIPYTISVTNNNAVNATSWDDYKCPYGYELGENKFGLFVLAEDPKKAVLMYQWQISADNVTFTDIDGANCSFYKAEKSTTDKNNYWYRCSVNGELSHSVQIITRNSDTREWTDYYEDDWCYVSNGSIAYTIDEKESYFDIVAAYTVDGKTKMYQTSNGGNGWEVYCNNNDLTTKGTPFKHVALIFAFDDSKAGVLHGAATLQDMSGTTAADIYNNFAIVGAGKVGPAKENTAVVYQSKGILQSIAVAGVSTEDQLQDAINRGTGDSIPSFVITPITNESNTLPYYFLGSGYGAYEVNTSLELEKTVPGISISWMGMKSNSIEFDYTFGGATSNAILEKVSKVGTANTYSVSSSTSAIKGVKLIGDTLEKYAYTLGTPSDKVEVKLTFKSASTNSAISGKLPTYTAASSTTSTTNTSTSSKAYTANYFDASIVYKKNGVQVTDAVFGGDSKTELPVVLAMEVSYNFDEKDDIKVYRYHDGSASELSSGEGSDGTYKMDKDAGKITIYSSRFSTFAIAYKPTVYYTVTFSGASIASVKVKAGEKVAKPTDPTKEGYTFSGWYWYPNNPTKAVTASSSTSKTTTTTTSTTGDPVAYNFDNAVNSNITLTAGWVSNNATGLDSSKAAANSASGSDSAVNGARAPKTSDDLPVVWLWVLLLVAGVATFGCSLKELMDIKNGTDRAKRPMTKARKILLLIGIVISTTWAFILKKIRQNKLKALVMVGGAVTVVSVMVLATTFFQYHKSETIYSKADKTYVESAKDSEEKVVADGEDVDYVEGSFAENTNWWDCAQVNLKELKKEYPDVVGWIYFENEDISYPVMYSGDNSKYLRTTYTGEKAKAGSIFIDGESTPDFTDPHSIVYGHNMHDLSMFGKLRYYRTNPDYYQDHQYFQIFTEDKVYRYQIFAYEVVADSHDVFWVFGKEPTGYFDMLKEIERDSYCKSGITANEADHVVTLATCTNKDDERLIVSAVRTDEYEYAQ